MLSDFWFSRLEGLVEPLGSKARPMRDVTGRNWGLLIAYILPGFVTLLAVGMVSPSVQAWLIAVSAQPAGVTVGGFLYLTLASVMAGLTASTIRWAVIDRLHHLTGLVRPPWDESRLQEKLGAFGSIVEDHYRYYQFYANTLVALTLLAVARLVQPAAAIGPERLLDAGIVILVVLFGAGSRDTLRRYYSRASVVMGSRTEGDVNDDQRKRSSHRDGPQRPKTKPLRTATPGEPRPSPAGADRDDRPTGSDERSPRVLIRTAGCVVVIRPN